MVTGALLVVALAVGPIAWAAPIFDWGGYSCWWDYDYCDNDDHTKKTSQSPSSPSGGVNINNSVVVNVNSTPLGNGTQGNVEVAGGTMQNAPAGTMPAAPAGAMLAAPAGTMPAAPAGAMPAASAGAMPAAPAEAMPAAPAGAMPAAPAGMPAAPAA